MEEKNNQRLSDLIESGKINLFAHKKFGISSAIKVEAVHIGDYEIRNSRMNDPAKVWIRNLVTGEGGDFSLEELNEALTKFFHENF